MHLHAAPHLRPELWHSQYFFKQWLLGHLHFVPFWLLLIRNSCYLFPQPMHQQSLVQAKPCLKHSQQFFWQRVLLQKHLRVGPYESAQVSVERFEVFNPVFSIYSLIQGNIGAGSQSQCSEIFLTYVGSCTNFYMRSPSSSFQSQSSIMIMICYSAYMVSTLSSSIFQNKKAKQYYTNQEQGQFPLKLMDFILKIGMKDIQLSYFLIGLTEFAVLCQYSVRMARQKQSNLLAV